MQSQQQSGTVATASNKLANAVCFWVVVLLYPPKNLCVDTWHTHQSLWIENQKRKTRSSQRSQ